MAPPQRLSSQTCQEVPQNTQKQWDMVGYVPDVRKFPLFSGIAYADAPEVYGYLISIQHQDSKACDVREASQADIQALLREKKGAVTLTFVPAQKNPSGEFVPGNIPEQMTIEVGELTGFIFEGGTTSFEFQKEWQGKKGLPPSHLPLSIRSRLYEQFFLDDNYEVLAFAGVPVETLAIENIPQLMPKQEGESLEIVFRDKRSGTVRQERLSFLDFQKPAAFLEGNFFILVGAGFDFQDILDPLALQAVLGFQNKYCTDAFCFRGSFGVNFNSVLNKRFPTNPKLTNNDIYTPSRPDQRMHFSAPLVVTPLERTLSNLPSGYAALHISREFWGTVEAGLRLQFGAGTLFRGVHIESGAALTFSGIPRHEDLYGVRFVVSFTHSHRFQNLQRKENCDPNERFIPRGEENPVEGKCDVVEVPSSNVLIPGIALEVDL